MQSREMLWKGKEEICANVEKKLRGQYSDAVLSELESQNDTHLEGMSAKVKMLKDVRFFLVLVLFTCLHSIHKTLFTDTS